MPQPAPPTHPPRESLVELLGGRRGAMDATVPPVVFVAAWLVSGRSVAWAAGAAVGAGLLVAAMRWRRGEKPRAVLLGLLGVAVAALVALRTGRAADFFLVQLVANAASALAWAVSIVIRWPLLGVVVGVVLGQRTTWRRDPDLVHAYNRASWVWVGQYVVRVAVFGLLYWGSFHWDGAVVALGIARVALSWPLIAACLAVSWWVLRRSLPAGHPGLRGARQPA